MRHGLALAAALCAASLVAACSDDASQAALTPAPQAASASSNGAANAFNSDIAERPNPRGAAPIAPPVIHYPPGEDDAADSADSTAVASPASSPN